MCHVVSLAGAVITTGIWKKTNNIKIGWLCLLFWGGALFGLVDHLWNKELFLISKNIANDLLLGITIAIVILISWVGLILWSKINPVLKNYLISAERLK